MLGLGNYLSRDDPGTEEVLDALEKNAELLYNCGCTVPAISSAG